MTVLPIEDLELQAVEQRQQLHERANEIKSRIAAARENLDIKKNAREHFMGAAGILGGLGLASGYAIAGLFAKHKKPHRTDE